MQVKAMRICGGPVKLIYTEGAPLGEHDIGHLDTYRDEITVRESCPETVQARAIMHEVVHHLGIANGLDFGPDSEIAVSAFSTALLAFIRENPGMVLELMLEANGRTDRYQFAALLLDKLGQYVETVYGPARVGAGQAMDTARAQKPILDFPEPDEEPGAPEENA